MTLRIEPFIPEAQVDNVRFLAEPEHVGHFAAMENPATLIEHVRETFRLLR